VCVCGEVGRSGGGKKKREGEECRVAGGGSIVNELQGGVERNLCSKKRSVRQARHRGDVWVHIPSVRLGVVCHVLPRRILPSTLNGGLG